MDCLRTAEILMAEHDGEPVSAEEAASARRHCASCAKCVAFTATLARLAELPAPRASAEAVERIAAMSAGAAADIREAETAARALAEASLAQAPEPSGTRGLKLGPGRWTPRFSAFAAAAAVIFFALGVGTASLLERFGARETPSEEAAMLEPLDSTVSGYEESGAAVTTPAPSGGEAALDRQAAAPAPPYVMFRRTVWLQRQTAEVAPSAVTTAGVVMSSLSDPGEASERTAFLDAGGTLWVARGDGTYAAFSPVVRTVGLRRYALTSEIDLPRFGLWPSLPSQFATPQQADGYPSFTYFGFDDLNRDIYVPVNGRIEDGFALPPGGGPDDPAGGNPGWTWWAPAD